ncbi:MAG: RdgB/HAM1 family non-canonical purine NTP pyrophosphatase [Oscillospiraceae bacterium]|jgi:XTP/dITP diphosphohydrolase|nr:RdgB/HAM1 family non-canonical purine NTP pyrophosphatase [Oscillospiraceae bacterium]
MKLLVATKNEKKRAELERILAPLGFVVVIDPALPEVEENGTTFEENARLKALAGYAVSGLPCVGDDSGLCVEALGGAPGVCSARFAGKHGNDGANAAKLLELLDGLPPEKRGARFVCALCCVFPSGKEILLRGVCEGAVAAAPKGKNGFGYDPVFLPNEFPGKTMAQLSAEQKDAISHRGRALRLLANKLKEELA